MSRLPLILALAAGVTCATVMIDDGHAQPVTTPDIVEPTPAPAPARAVEQPRKQVASTSSKSRSTTTTKKKKKKTKASPRVRANNLPPGFKWPITRSMRAQTKQCESALTKAGVPWKRTGREGRIVGPIVVPSMRLGGIEYISGFRKAPHRMDCNLALVLEQIGPKLHALGVRSVKFGSIYRWSNVRVNGTTKPFLSRHALGIAMDIVSFTDDTGRTSVVSTDYPQGDELLIGIENAINASGRFRTVLTPQNDPVSHDDHFHVEVAVDYRK